jgi:hypothetical protein
MEEDGTKMSFERGKPDTSSSDSAAAADSAATSG